MLYTLDQDTTIYTANGPASKFVLSMQNKNYKLWASTVQGNITSSDEIPQSSPTRDFIIIEFEDDKFPDIKQSLETVFNNPSCLIYRISAKNDRLVLDLSQELNSGTYKNTYQSLCIQLGVKGIKAQARINHGIKCNSFSNDAILLQIEGLPYNVPTTIAPASIMPNKKKLLLATQEFIDSKEGQRVLHDQTLMTRFFDALAAKRINGQLDSDYLEQTMRKISTSTGFDLAYYTKLIQERIDLLSDNPDLLETAPPFGEYIHLYSQAKRVQTIGQQLVANLPAGTIPSSDYELAEASDFIEMAYPPYLLDQYGSDVDNVVIFNPTTGVWTHDTDIMYSLLTAIRPYSTKQQFDTFMLTFAAKARNSDRIIKPYSGSRYILFNNCALDVATMEQYAIDSPIVRNLHFTNRNHIEIDYIENPALPVLPHKRQFDNGNWTPKAFLQAYANNDEDVYQYLLFGFSLGLFGGHNSGVHFDIQGGSRWGKTTLFEIFKALYKNRVVSIPFSSLNEQFPFTSYPDNTSIIWVSEVNVGTEPLDDRYGTTTYDALADTQVRFQVKNRGDLIISNPPQCYFEGTSFIKANELDTGPAGRTLAYKLPEMTTELRNQSYSSSINDCLRNEKVLQWLVYQMIMAYKSFIPVNRMDDLRLNLANKNDLAMFPHQVQEWRKEFVIGGTVIDDWFEDSILPFLSRDAANPTYMHNKILYYLYLEYYKAMNPNDTFANKAMPIEKVIKRLNTIWNSERDKIVIETDIGTQEKDRKSPRKRIVSPDAMNFNWADYDKENERPMELKKSNLTQSKIFGKKIAHWFSIYVNEG